MNKKEEAKKTKYYADEDIIPPECDELCRFRMCYHKTENKGTFKVGQGYISYHDDFRPVCGVRMNNGCGDQRDTYDQKKALRYCIEKLQANGSSKTIKQVIAIMLQMEGMIK
jgi:hypothetical protein